MILSNLNFQFSVALFMKPPLSFFGMWTVTCYGKKTKINQFANCKQGIAEHEHWRSTYRVDWVDIEVLAAEVWGGPRSNDDLNCLPG